MMNTKEPSMFRATLLCLTLLTAAYAATSKGAVVQNFVVNGKEIKITTINQSDQSINGYTIRIEMTLPDGRQTFEEETELYPPRGKTLLPHQTVVNTYELGGEVSAVQPRIVVALYNNGTAEAEKQATLDQVLSMRVKAARDLKLTPDEIKTYVNVRRLP